MKHPKVLAAGATQTVLGVLKVLAFSVRHPRLARVVRGVRARRLSYLSSAALVDLALAVRGADRAGVTGAVVEAGTALGGSAIVIGRSKTQDRPLWLFDAFGTIPPPTAKDGDDVRARHDEIAAGASSGIGGDVYYGYREDLLGDVERALSDFGLEPRADSITFVKGHYEETMQVDFPVAVAHLDCDWYESVMVSLRAIEPHLVPGGRFVIDDYGSWSGCTRAVDEFFAGRDDFELVQKTRMHAIKRAG